MKGLRSDNASANSIDDKLLHGYPCSEAVVCQRFAGSELAITDRSFISEGLGRDKHKATDTRTSAAT